MSSQRCRGPHQRWLRHGVPKKQVFLLMHVPLPSLHHLSLFSPVASFLVSLLHTLASPHPLPSQAEVWVPSFFSGPWAGVLGVEPRVQAGSQWNVQNKQGWVRYQGLCTERATNKVWYVHTMEYCSALTVGQFCLPYSIYNMDELWEHYVSERS